jgi:predicted HTH transcriptional regulator
MYQFDISTLEDIAALRESAEVECKLAQGRDGKGKLPKDVWESYSAFANTQGGHIFLGLKELDDGSFELAGVADTQKVIDEFCTTLRNPQAVNIDILDEHSIEVITFDGLNIIHITVPRATRKQRPVYIRGNLIGGSYKRLNSADSRLTEEEVRRVLAEQVSDSRDAEILEGFDLEDLDAESLRSYRQMYTNRDPDHPWNRLGDEAFLKQIGGWSKDRKTGVAGLTRAGLLMFGSYRPILDAFENYMVDYQERPENAREARWTDRLVPDGRWSGNLFDFYLKVILKLTAGLKVPFVLEGGVRQDDTPVHKALREALVNTLVHADYTGRSSVLVTKGPDMFTFRNPGNMRVPVEIAIEGGESDCRNSNLKNMFRYIGLGESAGSGMTKIFDGWNGQHWHKPLLKEVQEPSEQTLLELHTLSLVPEHVLTGLRDDLGEEVFNSLSDNERLILVTASIEKTVDHARMMSILGVHPSDLSSLFAGLVDKEYLRQEGKGRGTIYFLPATKAVDVLLELGDIIASWDSDSEIHSSGDSEPSTGGSVSSIGGSESSSGGYSKDQLEIAGNISQRTRAPKADVEKAILALCSLEPTSLEQLHILLKRAESGLRKDYLRQLLREKKLRYKFPTKPQHPSQAYITVGSPADKI